jgi:hypothetical protein
MGEQSRLSTWHDVNVLTESVKVNALPVHLMKAYDEKVWLHPFYTPARDEGHCFKNSFGLIIHAKKSGTN